MSVTTLNERCGCGATFNWSGLWSSDGGQAVEDWRKWHRCSQPPSPGPCWHDSGVTWPGESAPVRCDLQAGHEGAHEAERPNGGRSVWPSDSQRAIERLLNLQPPGEEQA